MHCNADSFYRRSSENKSQKRWNLLSLATKCLMLNDSDKCTFVLIFLLNHWANSALKNGSKITQQIIQQNVWMTTSRDSQPNWKLSIDLSFIRTLGILWGITESERFVGWKFWDGTCLGIIIRPLPRTNFMFLQLHSENVVSNDEIELNSPLFNSSLISEIILRLTGCENYLFLLPAAVYPDSFNFASFSSLFPTSLLVALSLSFSFNSSYSFSLFLPFSLSLYISLSVSVYLTLFFTIFLSCSLYP